MWFSVSEHLTVILYSALMGILLGIIYDFVKTSRVILGVSTYSRTASKLSQISLPLIKKQTEKKDRKKGKVFAVVILFIGDIVYSLVCAAVYSLFLFHAIRGQVRWYFLLATAIAFFLYYFTLSRFIIVIIETLFFGVKALLTYLREIFFLPFRLLIRLIRRTVNSVKHNVFAPLIVNIKYKRNTVYTEKKRLDLITSIKLDFKEV